jgi:hypothetical protein
MKKVLIPLITLILGFAIGLIYGWRSGYADGTVNGCLPLTVYLPEMRALSTNPALNEKLDILAASTAGTFASNYSYSPFMYFTHPKADGGIMDMLVYRDVFASDLPAEKFAILASLKMGPKISFPAKAAELRAKYPAYFAAASQRWNAYKKKIGQN